MSMKNCNYTIGNRTRDLPTCSALPQPTAPPRATQFLFVNQHKSEEHRCVTGSRTPRTRNHCKHTGVIKPSQNFTALFAISWHASRVRAHQHTVVAVGPASFPSAVHSPPHIKTNFRILCDFRELDAHTNYLKHRASSQLPLRVSSAEKTVTRSFLKRNNSAQ